MMIGEPPRLNTTVHIPSFDLYDDYPMANIHSPFSSNIHDLPFENLMAFQRYLTPENVPDDVNSDNDDVDVPADKFVCDQFRMYEFKVRKCARARSHDWTECPYAHPGEKARRRDPRKYHYSGCACPDFRKGECNKGDNCEYAHGVFECWLHPARYRTQPCKDGTQCRRRVCFFAHTTDQLRILPLTESYDGSPARLACNSTRLLGLSPNSDLHSLPSSPTSDYSPPVSPSRTLTLMTDSLSNLQIGNRTRMTLSPPAWGVQSGSGMCSPRSPLSIRPGFMSMPSTPTQNRIRSGLGVFDQLDNHKTLVEEPIMERVESGKDLRAKMYAKLSHDNSLDSTRSSSIPGQDYFRSI